VVFIIDFFGILLFYIFFCHLFLKISDLPHPGPRNQE